MKEVTSDLKAEVHEGFSRDHQRSRALQKERVTRTKAIRYGDSLVSLGKKVTAGHEAE